MPRVSIIKITESFYNCIYDLDVLNTTEPMEFATVLYNLRISGFIFHEKFEGIWYNVMPS